MSKINSFIYESPDLINKLISVAQSKNAPTQQQLNATAIQVINNLRAQLSPLKASVNPGFVDIESLNNFKTWAIKNKAESQGNPLVDPAGRFNTVILGEFLTDLRDRFVSNPEFSESLANVIDQANKTLGLKIPLYPPIKQENPAAPASDDPSQKPGSVNVSFKANESVVDPKTSKPTPGQVVSPQQQMISYVSSGGLSLLDGTTLDFDDIHGEARHIAESIGSNPGKANVRASQMLGQVIIRISNITGNFSHLIQGKTPGLNTLSCTPQNDGTELENIINNTFNNGINQELAKKNNQPLAYRYDELAEISKYFAGLMVEVASFYNMLLTIPFFKNTPDIESVLQKQLEWATTYNTNFMSAQQRFMGKFTEANKIR